VNGRWKERSGEDISGIRSGAGIERKGGNTERVACIIFDKDNPQDIPDAGSPASAMGLSWTIGLRVWEREWRMRVCVTRSEAPMPLRSLPALLISSINYDDDDDDDDVINYRSFSS
jgi:hypothetical protein